MAECTDSPRAGVIGCGGKYGGELQHCVAKVSWSTHPDGRAHVTGSLGVIDTMWAKGNREPANPADLGFEPDSRGRWRTPMSDEVRQQLSEGRSAPSAAPESDETDG